MIEHIESTQPPTGAAFCLGVAPELSLVLLSFLCAAVAVSFARGAWFRATGVAPNHGLVVLEILGCVLFLRWNSVLAGRKTAGLNRLHGVNTIGDALLALLVLIPLSVFLVFALLSGLQTLGLR